MRSDGSESVGDTFEERVVGPSRELSEERLHLRPRQLDRIEVRRVRRKKEELCAMRLDALADAKALVGGEIVHDDDVAVAQLGAQDLFDVGRHPLAAHAAVPIEGRDDARVGEACGHGNAVAPILWLAPDDALPFGPASVGASHREIHAALIEEKKASPKAEQRPKSIEVPSQKHYIVAFSFGRVDRLFFRVRPSFASAL
jgi:hypothetical protein